MKKLTYLLVFCCAAAFASAGSVSATLTSSTQTVSLSGDYSLTVSASAVNESLGAVVSSGTHTGNGSGLPFVGGGSIYRTNNLNVFWQEGSVGEGLPAHIYCYLFLGSNASVKLTWDDPHDGTGHASISAQVNAASPLVGVSLSFAGIDIDENAAKAGTSKTVVTLSPTWTLVHTDGAGKKTWKTTESITTATATAGYAIWLDGGLSAIEQTSASFGESYFFSSLAP